MFAGRAKELTALAAALDSPQPALILITGRPRIGKSRLIHEACHHRPVIYLQAAQQTARLNFLAFKQACLRELGTASGLETQNEWLGLLSCVAIAAQSRDELVVVLDNFSALCDSNETLPFTIRTIWQSGLVNRGRLKLILCGSNISKITDLTRGTPALAQHALSDCKTELFDIGPLPPHETVDFFPEYSDEARVAAYAIFGGVPAYLRLCQPGKTLAGNIVDLLLRPDGQLLDEPAHLLANDLRDAKVYASILRSISIGYRESGDIKSFIMGGQTGMSISPYLEKLKTMRLISDVRTIDADPKARNIRFSIQDPLTRFWNLFIQPNRLQIDRGHGQQLFDTTIKRQISDYMVLGFEDICRDYMRNRAQELLTASSETVGQMWGTGYNIAIAGRLTDRTPIFGACEWHTRAVGEAGAEHLIQQVRLSDQAPESPLARVEQAPLPYYVLFSRSGFTPELQNRADKSDDLRLVTPSEIVRVAA
jgi:uncharacterized protein